MFARIFISRNIVWNICMHAGIFLSSEDMHVSESLKLSVTERFCKPSLFCTFFDTTGTG